MNKYTVRSFEKMPGHPGEILELVDEDYFRTMDECERWCAEQFDIKNLNFQIHHSLGASNYRFGIGCGTGLVSWVDRDYTEHDYPTIRPWWSIYDVPSEVDAMCEAVKL